MRIHILFRRLLVGRVRYNGQLRGRRDKLLCLARCLTCLGKERELCARRRRGRKCFLFRWQQGNCKGGLEWCYRRLMRGRDDDEAQARRGRW